MPHPQRNDLSADSNFLRARDKGMTQIVRTMPFKVIFYMTSNGIRAQLYNLLCPNER